MSVTGIVPPRSGSVHSHSDHANDDITASMVSAVQFTDAEVRLRLGLYQTAASLGSILPADCQCSVMLWAAS